MSEYLEALRRGVRSAHVTEGRKRSKIRVKVVECGRESPQCYKA